MSDANVVPWLVELLQLGHLLRSRPAHWRKRQEPAGKISDEDEETMLECTYQPEGKTYKEEIGSTVWREDGTMLKCTYQPENETSKRKLARRD